MQRTAGNAATATLVAPRFTSRSEVLVNRFTDVTKLYGQDQIAGLSTDERDTLLGQFLEIQRLLNDTDIIRGYLTELAAYMGANNVTLDEALRQHQAGTWADAQPILTGFVPAQVFEGMVDRGELFVDLVAKGHGIQTHRIQWYLIARRFGNDVAMTLYREAVAPRWKRGGKNMWDRVVDELGLKGTDFTQPDRLEDFLLAEFQSLCSRSDMGRMTGQVKDGHDAQQDTKKYMRSQYPPENKFTKALKQAKKEFKNLERREARNRRNAVTEPAVLLRKAALLKGIEQERVVHRHRGHPTYQWTGWILGPGDNPKNRKPFFEPTVAYPVDRDSDETGR